MRAANIRPMGLQTCIALKNYLPNAGFKMTFKKLPNSYFGNDPIDLSL